MSPLSNLTANNFYLATLICNPMNEESAKRPEAHYTACPSKFITKALLVAGTLVGLAAPDLQAQKVVKLSDTQVLQLYDGLRVTDVCDGMNMIGLANIGLMDQSISPLWKDTESFEHQIVGIAFTVKYVPTQKKTTPDKEGNQAYKSWRDHWYSFYSGEPFIEEIEPGHVVVIENDGDAITDCGSIGSNNSMVWKAEGSVGVICSGGMRDIDQVIKQRIPVYTDYLKRGRGIRPGRNELESYKESIIVGGVVVNPGDVVVADTDGVIVVPRERAVDVAYAAKVELLIDKESRRKLYEKLGIPLDFTVK